MVKGCDPIHWFQSSSLKKVDDVNTNVMSFVINCHMQLIVHK